MPVRLLRLAGATAALWLVLTHAATAAPAARLRVTGGARPFVEAVVAGGADGAAAWWQPEEDQDGGRFWAWPADADAARPGGSTAGDVARALGATANDGPGVVAGLALDGGDWIVLWRGKVAGRTTAAVVRIELAAGTTPRLRVEVDPRTMVDALDLGPSLVLVDLSLMRSGGELYVLARDLDRVRLLRRSLGGYGLGTRLEVQTDKLDLRRADVHLSAGPGEGLLATWDDDGGVTHVWQIDRDGAARPLANVAGLPLGHAPAAAAGDRIWLFAADTARAATRGPPTPLGDESRLNFPALLRIDSATGTVPRAIGRDELDAPATLAVYALNPASLAPAGAKRFVGFDPLTGKVLRIDLNEP